MSALDRLGTVNANGLKSAVLPLYLYLDEQHTEWMSERVLQHVLTDLRPLIIPKLIAEESAQLVPGGSSNAKKGSLDVHRGETYQFGYFLRNTEPHSVLIKTRRFTAAPPRQKPTQAPEVKSSESVPADDTGSKKRSRSTKKDTKAATSSKRRNVAKNKGKGKGKQKETEIDSEEEEAIELSDDEDDEDVEASAPADLPPRRSARKRTVVSGIYREDEAEDVEDNVPDIEMSAPEADGAVEEPQASTLCESGLITMDSQEVTSTVEVKAEELEPILAPDAPNADNDPIEIDNDPPPAPEDTLLNDDDIEEEKPKPILKLKYQGFSIRGRALCVIVEPYPPLRKRAISLAPTGIVAPRAPSIAPPDFVPSGQRAKTPLFFPEDDRARSVTPAPWGAERERPPVPLFDETAEDEEDEEGGMMAFSQILHSVGEYATGAAEDDDEIEGAVFLGDADEARGQ